MWEFLLNLIEFLIYWFCFNDVRQRVPKEIFIENPWLTPKFMKQNSGRQLHNIFSGACLLSKHFALLMMWWRHLMCPSDPYYKCSLFKLIYYQIWTFLVLGDWSWSGNIKQDFLMISHICCFIKKTVNKWAYISETPPNKPDYPCFSKCTLNLGLEKHMLISSADMSHLSPFSHWSILDCIRTTIFRNTIFDAYLYVFCVVSIWSPDRDMGRKIL